MKRPATKPSELDRRCPGCGAVSLTGSAGRTGRERALWLLEKAIAALPDDDADALAAVGAAMVALEDAAPE